MPKVATSKLKRMKLLKNALFAFLSLLVIVCKIYGQTPQPVPAGYSGPVNFVRVWEPVKPFTSEADVINTGRNTKEVRQTTQYIDGLGRPIQTVVRNGSLDNSTNPNSPVQTDMVMPVVYDAFGREQLQYLPYASASETSGNFKTNPFNEQINFYNTQLNGQTGETNIAGRNWAYSKTNFEASPLSRVNESYAPGASWVGSEGGSTPHPVKMKYWINTADDAVRIWTVNEVANGFGTYSTTAIYPAGELYKNVTEDEHGKQVIEFKDKEGKVVLKKVQLTASAETTGTGSGHSGWICTYYIYDDLNNLRAVLQPEGVKLLNGNNWANCNPINASIYPQLLPEQTFRYEYDHRNRMIMKKVPGAGEVYMLYDQWDRLLLTQDAKMRSANQYLFTKYDVLNRPVMTGIYTYTGTIQDARNLATTNNSYRFEERVNSGEGYTSRCWPEYNYEVLTVTYYDDYNWYGNPFGSTYNNAYDVYFTNSSTFPYPQTNVQSLQTKGLITGSKVKVLGSLGVYLYNSTFYDDKGRPIQVLSKNITNGIDVVTTQFGWAGQPVTVVTKTESLGNPFHVSEVASKYYYDDLGRISKITKTVNHSNNGTWLSKPEKDIVINEYDKLGQLKKKKLSPGYNGNADGIENLSYDYNIRGWMLGMNRNYLQQDNNTKFGFELAYDKKQSAFDGNTANTYGSFQFNGNITGMMWRSMGDGQKRKYDFDYDAVNRLTKADFKQYNSGWNVTAGIDFSVGGNPTNNDHIAYDDNGNIKEMWQKGLKIGGSDWIDQMRYTYNLGTNKLKSVTDFKNEPATTLGDFKTIATHTQSSSKSSLTQSSSQSSFDAITDYDYDVNGNLTVDYNKGISSITYNYLNLPQAITVNGKGTITYTYDAAGNKLKKTTVENNVTITHNNQTSNNTVTTTTDYIGGFVYESKAYSEATVLNYTHKLQFGGHEEGRTRALYDNVNSPLTLTGFAYDYMLKDHLGNVRMVLTDELKPASVYQATMEASNRTNEVQLFTKIPETESGKPASGFDSDGNNQTVSKLFNSSGSDKRVGPGVVLKVMAGDKFKARTFGWYLPNGTNFDPLSGATSIVSSLVAAFTGGVPGGGSHSGAQLSSSGILDPSIGNFLTNQNNQTVGNRPKAYLNWMILDEEQFKLVDGNYGVVQVPEITGSMGKQVMQANGGNDIEVKKNGYLYVYVSNESQGAVYFDDIRIEHTKGSLIEETHYYPFGLTMAGISSKAAIILENKKRFNKGCELQSKEFSDGSGLELYSTQFRSLDPQLGRWWQIDPKPEQSESPYSSMKNNPILLNDPLGDTVRINKNITQNLILNCALAAFAGTKEGQKFLANYAAKGQTIAGITFTKDGKFSKKGIDLNFDTKVLMGSRGITRTAVDKSGRAQINIFLDANNEYGDSGERHNSLNVFSRVVTFIHESFIHADLSTKDYLDNKKFDNSNISEDAKKYAGVQAHYQHYQVLLDYVKNGYKSENLWPGPAFNALKEVNSFIKLYSNDQMILSLMWDYIGGVQLDENGNIKK